MTYLVHCIAARSNRVTSMPALLYVSFSLPPSPLSLPPLPLSLPPLPLSLPYRSHSFPVSSFPSSSPTSSLDGETDVKPSFFLFSSPSPSLFLLPHHLSPSLPLPPSSF